MKFTSDKNTLLKEISIAHEIISSKNALSILSNVLLETVDNTLNIKATDLKVAFQTEIPVQTLTPGSTTVFCDKFLGILRSLPDGEIIFEQEEDHLLITVKDRDIQFTLRSISSEKFPELKSAGNDTFFDVSQRDFMEMVDQTIFAVSDDETRFFLNGVYMEQNEDGLTMVATDGRRLSFISRSLNTAVPSFSPVIIPPKFLHLITKLASKEGNLSLAISDNYIFAHFDSHKLSSTLIEGKFPNYRRVIPEEQTNSCIIDRAEFFEAFKRVSLLVEQKSRRIYFDIEEGHLLIYSEESDIGIAKEKIACEYEGEKVKLALNYLYLMHPVRAMGTDKMVIEFTDHSRAITIRPEPAKDFFHIIMPMQID